MAYSGSLTIIDFQAPDASIAVNTSLIDISTDPTTSLAGSLAVPVPLMLYGFGVYCMETVGATATGSILLERSVNILTDATSGGTSVAEIELDTTSLSSGDGVLPRQTALTASSDIVAGDVVMAPAATFPLLIAPNQTLQVRYVQSGSNAGEFRPFIVVRWQGIDARSTEQWTRLS